MAKKGERFFAVGKPTGWKKDDSQDKRRRTILRSRKGDVLASARALTMLSNVSQDSETARKAKIDADYFYKQYRKKKG